MSGKTDHDKNQGLEHIEGSDEKHGAQEESTEQVNVLAHLSKADLLSDVDHFIADKGLEEYREDLVKGALLAQNPLGYQDIEELNAEDKEAIAYEYAHRWKHPFTLYFTIAVCSLGKANRSITRKR